MRNFSIFFLFLLCAFVLFACHQGVDRTVQSATVVETKIFDVEEICLEDEGEVLFDEIPNESPMLRLAIIGDMNGNYGSKEYPPEVTLAIDRIIEEKPDIVINVGDMVAGQRARLDYQGMWASFHATVSDRLNEAGILMAQIPGNHDGSAYPQYANERSIYLEEWSKRKPLLDFVEDSMYPLYYSFILKDVLFLALDATTLDPLDDAQYEWLVAQLEKNAQKLPVVVFGHVPLFSLTTIKSTETLRDPRLKPLFEREKITLFITGHQHAYFPAHNNGISYLHAGALGGGPRPLRFNTGVAPKTLTFVNIYEKQKPAYETLVMDAGQKRINLNKLPTYLKMPDGILARHDIKEEDAEFAYKHWISAHITGSQMRMLISAYKKEGLGLSTMPEWELSIDASGQIIKQGSDKISDTLNESPQLRELMR